MWETVTGVLGILTSGAGGGIIGGVLALFKGAQELKERIAMKELEIKSEKLEYEDAAADRKHALTMLTEGAQIELEKIETETEAATEIAHQNNLGRAQEVLTNLNTTRSMDNYRASVRPTLAYWAIVLFSTMIVWAFYKYGHLISNEQGLEILLGMFATLTFTVTSVVTFYYVARRNKPST